MSRRFAIAAGILALGLTLSACGGNTGTPEQSPTLPLVTAPPSVHSSTPSEPVPNNTQILLSTADAVVDMDAVKREHYDNGTYYYLDENTDGTVRCFSSCYRTTMRADETPEEYATRRAVGLSAAMIPGNAYNVSVAHNQELSDALGYPVYLVGYYTGSDPNTLYWTVYLTQTEHYSYQYAFASTTLLADLLEDAMTDYFCTLKLENLPNS